MSQINYMAKDAFVRTMADEQDITIKEARQATNLVLTHIRNTVPKLEDGGKLDLTGHVQFEVSDVPARKARNPKTGETVEKEATRKVVVRPMTTLKSAVKGE